MKRNNLTGREHRAMLAHMDRLFDAQQKELTPTMLRFEHETHVIRIEEDSHGFLTCTVRARDKRVPGVDHRIRFDKRKHFDGVVWTFRSGDRLSELAFEPDHPGLISEGRN